jgi:hypothetical protein
MFLLWLILIIYLVYTPKIIFKIYKTRYLNKNQKVVDTILVIVIPFLWGLFISFIIKPQKDINREEEYKKKLNDSYYESGKGFI